MRRPWRGAIAVVAVVGASIAVVFQTFALVRRSGPGAALLAIGTGLLLVLAVLALFRWSVARRNRAVARTYAGSTTADAALLGGPYVTVVLHRPGLLVVSGVLHLRTRLDLPLDRITAVVAERRATRRSEVNCYVVRIVDGSEVALPMVRWGMVPHGVDDHDAGLRAASLGSELGLTRGAA